MGETDSLNTNTRQDLLPFPLQSFPQKFPVLYKESIHLGKGCSRHFFKSQRKILSKDLRGKRVDGNSWKNICIEKHLFTT